MIPKYDEWTTVLLGLWNVRLFTPEWVKQHLFDDQEVELEFLIASGVQRVKFRCQSVEVAPQDERLVISVTDDAQGTLDRAHAVATQVLTLLEHTPVRALGVNFGFHEETPGDLLLSAFDLGDANQVVGVADAVTRTEVGRSLQIEGNVVNLKLIFEPPTVDIHVNFHWPATGAPDARETMAGVVMTDLRDRCIDILHTAYGAVVTQEERNVDAEDG